MGQLKTIHICCLVLVHYLPAAIFFFHVCALHTGSSITWVLVNKIFVDIMKYPVRHFSNNIYFQMQMSIWWWNNFIWKITYDVVTTQQIRYFKYFIKVLYYIEPPCVCTVILLLLFSGFNIEKYYYK